MCDLLLFLFLVGYVLWRLAATVRHRIRGLSWRDAWRASDVGKPTEDDLARLGRLPDPREKAMSPEVQRQIWDQVFRDVPEMRARNPYRK